MGPFKHIDVQIEDRVATIEYQRPEKYNAMNTEVALDINRACDSLQLNRDLEAVIITGQGDDAFSSGADIDEYAGPAEEHDPYQKIRQQLFIEKNEKLYDLHAPVIAKINGYCVGGGLVVASFCDIRIASEGSKFGVPTANIGQTPGGGSTYRLVELIGEGKTKEVVYTAGLVDAEEAHRIGLVNQVVNPSDLDDTVDELVDDIKSNSKEAISVSKDVINYAASEGEGFEDVTDYEFERWWDQFSTEEREKLVQKFLDE